MAVREMRIINTVSGQEKVVTVRNEYLSVRRFVLLNKMALESQEFVVIDRFGNECGEQLIKDVRGPLKVQVPGLKRLVISSHENHDNTANTGNGDKDKKNNEPRKGAPKVLQEEKEPDNSETDLFRTASQIKETESQIESEEKEENEESYEEARRRIEMGFTYEYSRPEQDRKNTHRISASSGSRDFTLQETDLSLLVATIGSSVAEDLLLNENYTVQSTPEEDLSDISRREVISRSTAANKAALGLLLTVFAVLLLTGSLVMFPIKITLFIAATALLFMGALLFSSQKYSLIQKRLPPRWRVMVSVAGGIMLTFALSLTYVIFHYYPLRYLIPAVLIWLFLLFSLKFFMEYVYIVAV
ncbi:MAG: hypothetical protein QW728_00680 [Thermoplasmata archaeon]